MRITAAATPAGRAAGEEADVAEVVQGFVARERGAGADAGIAGAVGWRDGFEGEGTGGFGREGLDGAVAEGVADDAVGVEVGEHFGAEGVDYLGDLRRERSAGFAELDEGVCGRGVQGEDERAQGFENVHACLAEAEGGEGD